MMGRAVFATSPSGADSGVSEGRALGDRGVRRAPLSSRATKPVVVGLLALAGVFATAVASQAATLQVVPVGNGTVSFTPAPQASDPADCVSSATGVPDDLLSGACTLTYAAGTVVRLEATGATANPATAFRRWSDDRCPAAAACSLTLRDGEQTAAAVFSPQRVSLKHAGAGSITSAPAGLNGTDLSADCDTPDGDCTLDVDPDLHQTVVLTAVGATDADTPRWQAADSRRPFLCDATSGPASAPACSVFPGWPRWVAVGFGDAVPDAVPTEVSVTFRVAKAGSGSGTIRSGSLDCGTKCSIQTLFGTSETFTAVPDGGSRFDGWRAACGVAATCRLAVGPVTSLTAVFEKGPGAAPGNQGTQAPQRRRGLAARLLRVTARGHGRRRVVAMRLRVNAVATVRARLLRGRRQVASRRWRLRAGTRVLRMRVPARARPGVYRVLLTVNGAGSTVRLSRGVRVRR
jgi:hypothetical protein